MGSAGVEAGVHGSAVYSVRISLAYSRPVSHQVPVVDILGVPLARLTPEGAIREIARLYDEPKAAFIAHVNAHTLNSAYEDPSYREVLRRADLVLNDGKGMMLAGRALGARFPADLNGNFMGPLVLELAAEQGWPVFFLGARPGVADRAAELLTNRIPGLNIAGTRDGFFSPATEDDVIAGIRDSGAGVLLAALGNPAQERWLDRCLEKTGARIGIGVGAFFDFQTGAVPRAPAWMNRIGLEWLHRLAKEPRRMWRRYILGNPKFVLRVLQQRLRRGRSHDE
jgi:exopolysaccharide biosynthesis WecB/TagA/CpsF family protein